MLIAGDSLVPLSTELTPSLCAVTLFKKRRGRFPGDLEWPGGQVAMWPGGQVARWPGGYDPVNGDQEPSNIQSGGWPDQNREQAGLRDSGKNHSCNLRYWSSF